MEPFEHQLDDGRTVLVRDVRPGDRERIRDAYAEASRSTIYRRFFSTRPALSEAELTHLSEVDQHDHVAWGAVDSSRDGHPGVGIARFIRDTDDPASAEVALAVADGWQGSGLGRALLAVLYCLGRERGISTLYGVTLFENRFLAEWFRELGATVVEEDGYFDVKLPLLDDLSQLPDSETLERFRQLVDRLSGKNA
jgi:GNAT superfamily N-acetyltransferase